MTVNGVSTENLYQIDGRVKLTKAVPYGLQHVLAMFVSNVTPIIILANIVGLESGLSSSLVQNAMIIAGIGTMIQLFPVWRIGSRLPVVMGISFTFLSLAIGIATSQGMGTLMGAVIVGGIVEGLLGLFAYQWKKVISPIIAAAVVTSIGFSLLPIGANSFAGGEGAADFGSAKNWIVGTVTLLTCFGFFAFAKGFLKSLSVLMGLIVGYVLAACIGMVNLSFMNVSVIDIPDFLPFKPEFKLGAILPIICIYLVSATETIGDTSALTSFAFKREPTTKELQGSISCDGFISSLSGLFGCTPITSFSQNVGLLAMNHVVNRFTIATGAAIMIIAGLFPAVGVVLTSIPQCVLGGCTIMMFGSILYTGFNMIASCGFTKRNLCILSLSLGIGVGFTQAPEMFGIFPDLIRSVFADNCVAIVFLIALVLDSCLPESSGWEME